MNQTSILLVDDDIILIEGMTRQLVREGYQVRNAQTLAGAAAQLAAQPPDIAILDYYLPDGVGMDLLHLIRKDFPTTDAIFMTAQDKVQLAVEALKAGARDFLTKPTEIEHLLRIIRRIEEERALQIENRVLRMRIGANPAAQRLIGKSPVIQQVRDLVTRAAQSRSTVLITGESGTGKELVSRVLHELSPSPSSPYVPVECSSINPNLFESELFGHVKGSFTGADRNRDGLFRLAGEGTLFLDEVAEIPPAVQAKMLRALQEREYRPVGGSEYYRLKARIVAATNVDLQQAMRDGRFREDLFYRLNVIRISLPPLRVRPMDIIPLAEHLIVRLNEQHPGRKVHGLTPAAAQILEAYKWPGNVRELDNCLEHCFAIGRDEWIDANDLPEMIRQAAAGEQRPPLEVPLPAPRTAPGDFPAPPQFSEDQPRTMAEYERLAIKQTLAELHGSIPEAAERLQVGKSTLYRKIKEYGLEEFAGRGRFSDEETP
ncbi:MAG: Regulatory protein AtoC [Myxococcota bacterium]|nr:Regulatory protein AtoC [Myxococcota bacterium]